MKRPDKVWSCVNFALSGILWVLGTLTYVLNVARCWEWWQAVGFACLCFAPIPAISQVLALVFSVKEKSKRLTLANAVTLIVTVAFILLTVLVSAVYG